MQGFGKGKNRKNISVWQGTIKANRHSMTARILQGGRRMGAYADDVDRNYKQEQLSKKAATDPVTAFYEYI